MEIEIKKRDLADIWEEIRQIEEKHIAHRPGFDPENIHLDLDELLCDALIIATNQERATPWLGMQIVETFNRMEKWYS